MTISAWSPFGEGAGGVTVDPGMAVLGVLQMSWLRLGTLSELLRRQVATDREQAGDPAELDSPEASGFVGFRYGAAGKDGVVYVQSEETRALVGLEAAERERVVKFAKVAHDMGVSDKLIGLAESWGDMVAGRIATMLDALQLSPSQAALVPALLQLHLGSLDMAALGSGT